MLAAGTAAAGCVLAALVLGGGSGSDRWATDSIELRGGSAQPAAQVQPSSAWCGGVEESADDRPDAAGGRQIHVIYAYPTDGEDRFASFAGPIVADIESIDAWWRRQDPTRAPRFDLFAFPGCPAGFDQLDLSSVKLPQFGAYYLPPSSQMARIGLDLGVDFANADKKYLVYYDGPMQDTRTCGQSVQRPDEGGRYAFSVVYVQACRADIGTGNITADVAAHELSHNLGAVPAGAPHACPNDPAHVCDDENDLMYPFTRGQGLNAVVLDSGRDDYYGHSGTWWDLRNSPWLIHVDEPQYSLNVSLGRSTGPGSVTSATPGIACPPACATTFQQGAQVELQASPGAGARFVGWSGGCTTDPCVVTMSTAQTVVALFAAQVELRVAVKRVAGANGTVESRPAGIACPSDCATTVDSGTRIRLTAKPAKGSAFRGWDGACAGKASCTVTVADATNVTAVFGPPQAFKTPKAKKTVPRCKVGQRPTRAKPCRPR